MAIIGALPVTLANGTTGDATQVMSDLNFIASQINANAAATSGGNTFVGSQVIPASGGRNQAAQTAQVQDGSYDFATDTSVTGGTITAALNPPITSYTNTIYWVKVVNANSTGTGATTLNLNAIGALPVTDVNGNALLTGMIVANKSRAV